MKKFIKYVVCFSFLIVCSALLVFYIADGTTDPFYLRFTSPTQSSLILGTSRAAQGLQPSIFNAILSELKNKVNLYNYSFTIVHSPYGPAYLKSIKKKLSSNTINGIFILTVDPWSLSSRTNDPNDSINFKESKAMLGELKYVNIKPNFFYLIKSYDDPYFNIIKNKVIKPNWKLHSDGWLEVSVKMDSISVSKRYNRKINEYRKKNLPAYKYSETRYEYLSKTISYLQKYGNVYLVRLPVSCEMLKMENELMPLFDAKIIHLAKLYNVNYFSFKDSCNKYKYTDGNHLYKASGYKVSKEIAELILNNEKLAASKKRIN